MASAPAGMSEAVSFGDGIVIEGIDRSLPTESELLPTGIAALDQALNGGLSTGILSEMVSSAPSSGGQTLLLHLLEAMRRRRRFVALVDGADRFDPQTTPPDLLEHLLWVRCRSAKEALAAADALMRDENLGMTLLDLRGCDAKQLRRIRSSDWYRLQRLVGHGSGYACVFTPQSMIPAAQTRVTLESSFSITSSEASVRARSAELTVHAVKLRQPSADAFPNLIKKSRKAAS